MRRIGIDVGGTNTDAVLIEQGKVVRAVKAPTSEDVTSGILDSLQRLGATGVLKSGRVDGVMIGTTHFINAVVQRRHLTKVAALRLGMPASASLPPFCDWPEDLAELVRGGVWMVEGGHEYDGRLFMPLDEAAVLETAREMKAAGLRSVGISSIFSPLDPSHEKRAAELVGEVIPGASITCSSDLGRIGLLERENAGLLNAALADLARDTIAAFEKAIRDSGIAAPLFITQNDGTVAEAGQARRLPVYSFASGATNSMRGAAYLSGLADAMVIDVGGTTTDVGQLRHGFPREANSVVKVGGVRTLFRMPDLLSIGLGGGSHVVLDPLKVGPLSVGYRLLKEGVAFGGSQLTTTDIAVASGVLDLGDRKKVAHLDAATCRKVFAEAARMAEEAIDRMKTEAGDVPLIAVGGGAFLIPDRLPGVSRVVHVEHGDCANAVGAAIAQVSGECDQIFKDMTRRDAIDAARTIANDRAVAAGADRKTLATIDSEDMPLALSSRQFRPRACPRGGRRRSRLSASPIPPPDLRGRCPRRGWRGKASDEVHKIPTSESETSRLRPSPSAPYDGAPPPITGEGFEMCPLALRLGGGRQMKKAASRAAFSGVQLTASCAAGTAPWRPSAAAGGWGCLPHSCRSRTWRSPAGPGLARRYGRSCARPAPGCGSTRHRSSSAPPARERRSRRGGSAARARRRRSEPAGPVRRGRPR